MTREWNGSEIMQEYARIASENGLLVSTALLAPAKDARRPVGNPDKTPETPMRNKKTEQYDVRPEGAGTDLVQKAHPKDARPADAMGDGGLVENIAQQQEKDIEVATSMPLGMLLGRHAGVVAELVRLANALDESGKGTAARRVDDALRRIAAVPFVDGLRKEAFAIPAIVWAIMMGAGALGGMAALGEKMTSLREQASTDLRDMLETLSGLDEPRFKAAIAEVRGILFPYVTSFSRPYPSTKDPEGLRQYIEETQQFKSQVEPRIDAIVAGLTASARWYWPFGAQRRLAQKWEDVKSSIDTQMSELRALEAVGKGALVRGETAPSGASPPPAATPPLPGSGIKGVQEILRERGIQVPVTGELDKRTADALRFLEQQLEVMLAPYLSRKGWQVRGAILKPDGTTMDPATLKELLDAADMVAGK